MKNEKRKPRKHTMSKVSKGRIHIVIGDTQVKPGVPTAHLRWIGQYIVDQFAGQDVSIVHLGDHWDMPSLSSYDKGKREMEGRRYKADISSGNEGFRILCRPLANYNKAQRAKRRKTWQPQRHFLLGNHEHRITRACEDNAQLEGTVSLKDINASKWGWTVHPFLEPVEIDGITYCHYFYHPNTGRPYGGENLYTRLKTIGHSFTMGHQQGLSTAIRPVGRSRHYGLVLGSTYLHEEKYLGPQGTAYWRGIVVCHQVEQGSYDAMLVSLEYLCRRYEGMTIKQYLAELKRKSTGANVEAAE